jgi:hypothetical protein
MGNDPMKSHVTAEMVFGRMTRLSIPNFLSSDPFFWTDSRWGRYGSLAQPASPGEVASFSGVALFDCDAGRV